MSHFNKMLGKARKHLLLGILLPLHTERSTHKMPVRLRFPPVPVYTPANAGTRLSAPRLNDR